MSQSRAQKPLVVLHVITGLGTGGAERSLVNLCFGGDREQILHHVVSLLPPGEMAGPLREAGIPVDSVNMIRGIPAPGALSRLVKLIKETKPDVIQGWMYHGNIAASLAAMSPGVKARIGWNIRNSLYSLKNEKPLTRLLIRLHRWLSRRPGLIVYNGRLSKQQHEAFGLCADHAMVIPNGFDLSRFTPDAERRSAVRNELGIPGNARVVGNVARLHPVKDHRSLLQALAPLMASMSDLHAVFVGRNVEPGNPALADLFSQLPAQRVHCLGERRDVERLLPALDLFCSSSYAEAFPNALAEAMACGVPCVATDAGDSEYIVGDTGLIVPVRDPAALSQALADALGRTQEQQRELASRARERIASSFSVAAAVDAYAKAWRAMLAGEL